MVQSPSKLLRSLDNAGSGVLRLFQRQGLFEGVEYLPDTGLQVYTGPQIGHGDGVFSNFKMTDTKSGIYGRRSDVAIVRDTVGRLAKGRNV